MPMFLLLMHPTLMCDTTEVMRTMQKTNNEILNSNFKVLNCIEIPERTRQHNYLLQLFATIICYNYLLQLFATIICYNYLLQLFATIICYNY